MRTIICALVACSVMMTATIARASAQDETTGPQVSLTLHDALALALANNLNYQAALADERAAEGQVIQARSVRSPSLSAGYSYVHTQNAGAFTFPVPSPTGPPQFKTIEVSAQNLNNVNATLQYALYSGGSGQAAIGQAAANLAGAQSQLAATRSTVVRDVTNAYFQLAQTQRAAAVADEAVSVAEQNLTVSEQLFKAGTAARADVLQQEVTRANSRVAAIQAHNAAALANAQLANLLNINLGSIITPTEPLEARTPSYTLTDLLEQAHNRPELAAAQDAVAIADLAVTIARAATLPAVNLTVEDASSKPNFENVPQPQLSETLAVTWKLFDGGLTHGRIVQARAQVDKAKINLKQLNNGVDLEVRQAYLNYSAALAQLDAAKSAQTSAQENLRVSQIRFRAGVGTSLELSNALLASTQAQNQNIAALAGLRIALVNVQRAAGLLPPPVSP
ncbi:MAG TPA: TolC family protein [Candidatus Eremiobacteraceae bacterium]|nr:TolC family protein [Candidatus Eremiobacteraceae bacterium]